MGARLAMRLVCEGIMVLKIRATIVATIKKESTRAPHLQDGQDRILETGLSQTTP